ncbi:MAG: hypothetical protein E6G03_02905 [Actinobacteria bacterium]|nr:MAG: hypothetical protein E6G03_02905 [Actinomycetota bacterium]
MAERRVREPVVRRIAGLPGALLVREREHRKRVAVMRHPRNALLEPLDDTGGAAGRESRK